MFGYAFMIATMLLSCSCEAGCNVDEFVSNSRRSKLNHVVVSAGRDESFRKVISLFSMPFCGMLSAVPSGSFVEKNAPSPEVSIDGSDGVRRKSQKAISASAIRPSIGQSQLRDFTGSTATAPGGTEATTGARPRYDRRPAGK